MKECLCLSCEGNEWCNPCISCDTETCQWVNDGFISAPFDTCVSYNPKQTNKGENSMEKVSNKEKYYLFTNSTREGIFNTLSELIPVIKGKEVKLKFGGVLVEGE